ncbi:MAG: response regulator [Actinomycetota bacterium]|nr:response regulator [Actinomycetota bacterium]
MNGKKILIIDDDPDFVESVERILEARGYSVDTAINGTEGVKKAKEITPDLILLDVMMTRKTEGFELSRELPKDKDLKSIPVIIITGIREKMNLPFGFEPDETWLPVKAVLEKTVKPDQLLGKIEEFIK